MRQGGSLSECDNRLKCRPRPSSLSHLIFDLGPYLKFSNPRFQETDRLLHHLTRQNSRSAHLREFCLILPHPEAFDLTQGCAPAYPRTSRSAMTLHLPARTLRTSQPHAPP